MLYFDDNVGSDRLRVALEVVGGSTLNSTDYAVFAAQSPDPGEYHWQVYRL